MRRERCLVVAVALGAALSTAFSGCTTVTSTAVKERRTAGVSRRYDRPAGELYGASLLALERIRGDHGYWSGLKVVESDPASGTVIAEQRLESPVIPGLADADAIGIFVASRGKDASEVTVVMLASDQVPGAAGTSLASFKGAESLVYPAIDRALEALPASPVQAVDAGRTDSGPAGPGSAPAKPDEAAPSRPGEPMRSPAPSPTPAGWHAGTPAASGSEPSLLSHVYDALRASGTWRPLVREVRTDGGEEIRIGRWARITAAGGRVKLAVSDGAGSAADAARLALELSQAGFALDVEGGRVGVGR